MACASFGLCITVIITILSTKRGQYNYTRPTNLGLGCVMHKSKAKTKSGVEISTGLHACMRARGSGQRP